MKSLFHLSILLLFSYGTYVGAQDIDEINQQIIRLQKEKETIRLSLKEWSRQRDGWINNNKNNDGIDSSIVKSLSKAELTALKSDLERFYCVNSKQTSLASGKNACPGGVYRCSNSYDCPQLGSSGPAAAELLKKMKLPSPTSNPKDFDQYQEMRNQRLRLFHTVDYEDHIRQAEASLLDLEGSLKELHKNKNKLDGNKNKYTESCRDFLKEMKGKVTDPSGMPINVESLDQPINIYIQNLHQGMRLANGIPFGEQRVQSYKNLRNFAEVLTCHGHRKKVKNDIEELENNLFESFKKSQNTNCKTVEQSDRDYNNHLDCTEQYLSNLPSTLRQLTSDASDINKSLVKKHPKELLDRIAKDQIDNALDNLARVDASLDLGHNRHLPQKDICHRKNFSDNFAKSSYYQYVSQRCNEVLNWRKNQSQSVVKNCGGPRLSEAQERFKNLMENVVKTNQLSEKVEKRDARIKDQTDKILSDLSDSFPEIAPLIYSPTFIAQAELDLDEVTLDFKPAGCKEIKEGLKDALINNIKNIATPIEYGVTAKNMSKLSQTAKRSLGEFYNGHIDSSSQGNAPENLKKDHASQAEIDELYAEIPELRNFPASDIFHLKSLLKHRPELKDFYMKEFEGNAKLICFLFKSIKKDDKRDLIIEKETKFIKGVSKAVGTTVAVGSFFVNPGLGYLLTTVALTTSSASSAANISMIEKKLNEARGQHGKMIDDCTKGLMTQQHTQTMSQDLVKKNCSEAVEAMNTAADLKEELTSTYNMTAAESLLYTAYLVRLGPQAVDSVKGMLGKGAHHHHHFLTWKQVMSSNNLSMTQKILESAKTIGHGDKIYGGLKVAKASYYMANVKKIDYVFSDPIKNGFYYATLEEAIQKKSLTSKNISDIDYKKLQDEIKNQVSNMSEQQIVASLNR